MQQVIGVVILFLVYGLGFYLLFSPGDVFFGLAVILGWSFTIFRIVENAYDRLITNIKNVWPHFVREEDGHMFVAHGIRFKDKRRAIKGVDHHLALGTERVNLTHVNNIAMSFQAFKQLVELNPEILVDLNMTKEEALNDTEKLNDLLAVNGEPLWLTYGDKCYYLVGVLLKRVILDKEDDSNKVFVNRRLKERLDLHQRYETNKLEVVAVNKADLHEVTVDDSWSRKIQTLRLFEDSVDTLLAHKKL